jgi:hypothetical protein
VNEQTPAARPIDVMPRGGPNASWLDRRKQHGLHEKNAGTALDVVSDIATPRILELGAGHGRLSQQTVRINPTARVVVDAKKITEPNTSYDHRCLPTIAVAYSRP